MLTQFALTKKIQVVGWPTFLLITLSSFLMIGVIFTPIYILAEPRTSNLFDALSLAFLVTLGMNPVSDLSNIVIAVIIVESLLSTIWFAIITALIVSKINNPGTKAYCAPFIGVYCDKTDGKHRNKLEFRFIVHPSPPLLSPEFKVSYYYLNEIGERETVPLELVPVQAGLVRYYLGFSAVIPDKLLSRKRELPLKSRLASGTVEVLVRAIDSQSDVSLNLLFQYSIPAQVKEGSFVDSVILDKNKQIIGVIKKNLHRIS